MNFGTTRLIALVLLIVAVGAQAPVEKLVGSVKLIDRKDHRTIGAINFYQPKASIKKVFMYANIWGIADGPYIAILHECIKSNDICKLGPARALINQPGDVTKGRQPMALFRRVFNESVSHSFTDTIEAVSLNTWSKNYIGESLVAIYRDTPAGLKLCSQSQNKTAISLAFGYVSSTLLGSSTPGIPSVNDV